MLDFPRWKSISVLLVCAFFTLVALPNVTNVSGVYPSWFPQSTVNLGLDLRGGSHLLYRIDFDAYLKERLESLRDEIRPTLRDAKIGYRNLVAHKDNVTFTIRPETLEEGPGIADLIQTIDPDLQVDEADDSYTVYYSETTLFNKKAEMLDQSIEIVNRRVNDDGTKEPIIQRQGDDRILVQVPGEDNPQLLKERIGKTARMTFHLVNESVSEEQAARGIVPAGTSLLPADDASRRVGADRQAIRYPVYTRVSLSGDLLTGANATFQNGQAVVSFTFNSLGARKFGEITSANVGKRFAVVLDKKVITAPVINGPINGGSGIIEGNFTVESANELAVLLRAGALPAPLNIIEERSVGPSLGADSIASGEKAIVVAISTVMIYMLMSYGLFGIISNIALLFNIIIIMGALSLFQATLTLPGIAGIVLTMGMAVDANTLIYERIREEIANGKSSLQAISNGFRVAVGTILDSNITTLIAAFILFYFGSGTVKGFAVTLSIGILSSMFSAVVLTKLMIAIWFKRYRPTKLAL